VLLFYLDEQVSELLASALQALGYDATSANRLGNKGLHDGLQLLIATNQGRVLITYNYKDFTLLHRSWRDWTTDWGIEERHRHSGILLVRSSQGIKARTLADAIDGFAQENHDLSSRLVEWNSSYGWSEVG
jgi:hypothetical protein